jgi:hypothetical protein
MSILRVDNITAANYTYNKSVLSIIRTLVKHYCYFTVSGGTPTVRGSFGQSSLTDSGVGTFTVNITSNFNNQFYVQAGHAEDNDSVGDAFLGRPSTGATKTTSSLLFTVQNAAPTAFDPSNASIFLSGDKS